MRSKRQEHITKLLELSARRASIDEFMPYLTVLWHELRGTASDMANEFIYRARLNSPGRLFETTAELKYPPVGVATKGRLNDTGESIFYGCLGILELMSEVPAYHPYKPRLFTYAKIQKKKSATTLVLSLGVPALQPTQSRADHVSFEYFHNEMRKAVQIGDEDLYNSTIAIGKFVLTKRIVNFPGSQYFALAYPSVAASNQGVNIAMLPELFESNYSIVSVAVCCMANFRANDWRVNTVNRGQVESGGSIRWEYNYAEMMARIRKGLTLNDSHLGGNPIPDHTISPEIMMATDDETLE